MDSGTVLTVDSTLKITLYFTYQLDTVKSANNLTIFINQIGSYTKARYFDNNLLQKKLKGVPSISNVVQDYPTLDKGKRW